MAEHVTDTPSVQLTRAEFFELLSKTQKVQLLQMHAQKAVAAAQAADTDAHAFMNGLGEQHAFDATATWRMDDTTCTLVPA